MHAPGDIRVEEVPRPVAGTEDVPPRVAACGVCGSDIPRMPGKGAHRMPIIRGHEFSGHAVEIGGDVEGFAEGEPASVAPLVPCRQRHQRLTGSFSRGRDDDCPAAAGTGRRRSACRCRAATC